MKNIDLIIPTRNRLKHLRRCLNSIPKEVDGIKISVIIVCDGDSKAAAEMVKDDRVDEVIFVRDHSGSVYCRNLATQTADDALIYAVDDFEFLPGSIERAVKEMRMRFPDGDGLIGFNHVNGPNQSKAGTCLVGQKFLRRYPNRKLFYPKYFHFSCQEIERLGERLGKLHFEEEARTIHYHPGRLEGPPDKTHEEARRWRKEDRKISSGRRAEGLIWGLDHAD